MTKPTDVVIRWQDKRCWCNCIRRPKEDSLGPFSTFDARQLVAKLGRMWPQNIYWIENARLYAQAVYESQDPKGRF